jgi:ferritin-like metal-binding protein YciE/ElaB/YqjD/DUF883 family membrane-anchored ribosome-binding protein
MTYGTNPERNLNREIDRTADQARQAVNQASDRAKDVASDVQHKAENIAADVQRKAERALDSAQSFDLSQQIRERPWLFVGAAVAAAFLFSRSSGRGSDSQSWQPNQQAWQGQQYGQPSWQQGQQPWQSQQPWQGQQPHWENPQAHASAMEQVKQYESSQREGMVDKLGRQFLGNMRTLDDLYHAQVQDLYDAEHQILKALPMMIEAASSPELKQAFDQHLHQTQNQIRRLEQVFQRIGTEPKGKTCAAMSGILAEGQEIIGLRADPEVKDAGLIAAAQRVEHYEIAGYGCLRTWARLLGHQDSAQLLQQSLNEEEQTDRQLSQLAERTINARALQQ